MTAIASRIPVTSLLTTLTPPVNTALAPTVYLAAQVTQSVLIISPFVESPGMITGADVPQTMTVLDLEPTLFVMETPMAVSKAALMTQAVQAKSAI